MLDLEKGNMLMTEEEMSSKAHDITSTLNNNNENVSFSVKGFSNTNGVSIYIKASYRDKEETIRFSDHGSRHEGINAGIATTDFEMLFAKVCYIFSIEGYVYEPTKVKRQEIEVHESHFKPSKMKVLSERITKNGNKMLKVVKEEPTHFEYFKK